MQSGLARSLDRPLNLLNTLQEEDELEVEDIGVHGEEMAG